MSKATTAAILAALFMFAGAARADDIEVRLSGGDVRVSVPSRGQLLTMEGKEMKIKAHGSAKTTKRTLETAGELGSQLLREEHRRILAAVDVATEAAAASRPPAIHNHYTTTVNTTVVVQPVRAAPLWVGCPNWGVPTRWGWCPSLKCWCAWRASTETWYYYDPATCGWYVL